MTNIISNASLPPFSGAENDTNNNSSASNPISASKARWPGLQNAEQVNVSFHYLYQGWRTFLHARAENPQLISINNVM